MKKNHGSLEVICGSMFSGKSEELIRRIRRAYFGKKKIQVFKHAFDDRHSSTCIHSHNGTTIDAIPIATVDILLSYIDDDSEIIGIDEIQFFSFDIINAIDNLIKNGKHIIVSGLDLDFRGIPFGPLPYLLAMADQVTKLKAVCSLSGNEAHFTQRLINGKPARSSDPIIVIGASNLYEARSRNNFEIDYIPLKEFVNEISKNSL